MWLPKISPLLLMLSFSWGANGQRRETAAATQYALIPPEDIFLMVAAQPNCPLQLENARLLYNLNTKSLNYQFGFRNVGKKPIIGFQVSALFLNGTGGSLTHDWEKKRQILLPGQALTDTDVTDNQIVPLTAQLRDHIKLTGKMRTAIVLFVEYVNFPDVPQFDDTKMERTLMDFLQKCGDCIDRDEPFLTLDPHQHDAPNKIVAGERGIASFSTNLARRGLCVTARAT